MLSGSRKTSTDPHGWSEIGDTATPRSRSVFSHPARLSREPTENEMWSGPVRVSLNGRPSLPSWVCRPVNTPVPGCMNTSARPPFVRVFHDLLQTEHLPIPRCARIEVGDGKGQVVDVLNG